MYDWVRLLAGVAVVLTSMISIDAAVDWRQPCSGESPADRVSRYVGLIYQNHELFPFPMADPRFPGGGSANSPGGANIRFFQNFPKTA